jgi:predicted Zn-dependent protease
LNIIAKILGYPVWRSKISWNVSYHPQHKNKNRSTGYLNYNWPTVGDEAIRVFKLDTELYPNSFNVYDSLADAYEKAGNKMLAIES